MGLQVPVLVAALCFSPPHQTNGNIRSIWTDKAHPQYQGLIVEITWGRNIHYLYTGPRIWKKGETIELIIDSCTTRTNELIPGVALIETSKG